MPNVSVDVGLEGAERAAVAEEAFAAVRHDVRNRLASVRSAAFFLRRRADKTEALAQDQKVQSFFDLIDSEVEAADVLLAGPAVLREEPKGTAECGVRRAAERALASLRAERPPSVQLDLPELPVVFPEVELSLLLRCLIENAADANPGGNVTVTGKTQDTRLVISVKDEGKGLSGIEPERAFAPFASTRPGKLGLGLPVARRTARRWGAEVSLLSSPAGCVAEVSLALARR